MDSSNTPSSDMNMSDQAIQLESAAPLIDVQDCYIECGCRMNNHLDGMPHQLAPYTLSLAGFDTRLAVHRVGVLTVAVFTPRLLPFPSPPPRSI